MSGIRRRALIDLDAFAANLTPYASSWLDARANAYGHGLGLLAPVARELGAHGIVVSDDHDAAIAFDAGFPSERVRIERAPTSEPLVAKPAYGMDAYSRPVLALEGEVVALKRVPADSGVSYGYTYRTSETTTLALVALGYADGVPRLASNRARVFVAGTTHPVVGRVAMDQLVLETGDTTLELGATAVLFGDAGRGEPTAVKWGALWTDRSPLTLTAGLADRVQRVAR